MIYFSFIGMPYLFVGYSIISSSIGGSTSSQSSWNTCETVAVSLVFEDFSFASLGLPTTPMKAQPYRYSKFHNLVDPKSSNHILAFSLKLVVHSSLQAATTIILSAKYGLKNSSRSFELSYVSNTLAK